MFDNIGGKIKGLAVVICFLGIIASVLCGIMLISQSDYYNPTATAGWIILIAGSLGSWIGSFTLYGFGELIEKTCENNEALLWMKEEMKKGKKELSLDEKETTASSKSTLHAVTCPSCGSVQPSFRTECWSCKAPLES